MVGGYINRQDKLHLTNRYFGVVNNYHAYSRKQDDSEKHTRVLLTFVSDYFF